MGLKQLKKLWNDEKEDYKTREVGTGVQNFVKTALKSNELFNLKEGRLKTKKEKRKKEFIHEKGTKEKRQADFIIYIDSEIEIPVEVECYTHIKKGIEQLKKYQKDLEKKYGILTDGFLWRFYNNENVEKEFNINRIFENPSFFLTFWKEYIKPIHYYSTFFERDVKELNVESHKNSFFEDITFLIKNFKNKLQIEGYFEHLEKKEREKKATEIAYSYLIQFILYKTLVDNDFGDFSKEYKQNIKLISNYINNNRFKDVFGLIEGLSAKISKNVYRPFKKEQNLIDEKLREIYHKSESSLKDVSPWLDIFVFIKKYNFQNIQNEIFGFIYENYLKELYGEEKKGQYFTDPNIVNLMMEQIGYNFGYISKCVKEKNLDKLSIMDPACGSGTFLYTACGKLIKSLERGSNFSGEEIEEEVVKNIFGLDIAEFPLYLAEMNIIIKLLPFIITDDKEPINDKIKVFWTKDSIAEFINGGLFANGQISLLGYTKPILKSFIRDEKDLNEMRTSMTDIPRRRFDFVIGNPPYISYNECSKQGIEIFKLIKEHKVKLSNIYGVNLHSIPTNPKRYPPKPNFYAFFIALGLALLKKNGKLSYIIPQTILIDPDYDVLRYHLSKNTSIEKIILFSTKVFVKRGLKQKKAIPTSSLIFIIKKKLPDPKNKVQIISYKKGEKQIEEVTKDIISMKNINKKEISQKILQDNVLNWNIINCPKVFIDFYEIYKTKEDVSLYYDHKIAMKNFKAKFYFDIGFTLNQKYISEKRLNKGYAFLDFNDFSGITNYKPSKYYPSEKSKIKLTKNSQGYITLDQKYKIIWGIKNTDRFYFTDKPIIFYMGKAGIICSNNRNEILYLLALLNSKITRSVLQNMFRVEHEDVRKTLVSIRGIKDLIKIPKITKENKFLKNEIIKRIKDLGNIESKRIDDFVDFSDILIQKFDKIKIENGYLIMIKGRKKIKKKIRTGCGKIKERIENKFLDGEKIDLSTLKNTTIIDSNKQRGLKDYIDDLVFALYLNLDLKNNLGSPKKVKKICIKNKFYKLI